MKTESYDARVINTSYSIGPVRLFALLASFMDGYNPRMDDICVGPPVILPDGCTIRQSYGECSLQSAPSIYYRMKNDVAILVWDPEIGSLDYDRMEEPGYLTEDNANVHLMFDTIASYILGE